MRRRFIADEINGARAALTGAHAAHLVRVLRARVGQQFDIATGDTVRRGTVSLIASEDRVEFDLGETVESSQLSDITLLLAIFKFDRLEWAIEKCTELGVARIIPVMARRTEVHLAKAAEKRVERWRRIAVQASEQSRRTAVPAIDDPVKLSREFLSRFSSTRIVLSEREENATLRELVDRNDSESLALAVGPEGGWTSEELQMFSECGWLSASLGPTILRAETAAIAALAIAAQ